MKVLLLVAGILAVAVGGIMLHIGLQHNPQMEFFDTETGKIDYQYCLLVFGVWFGITFTVVAGIGSLCLTMVKFLFGTRH